MLKYDLRESDVKKITNYSLGSVKITDSATAVRLDRMNTNFTKDLVIMCMRKL